MNPTLLTRSLTAALSSLLLLSAAPTAVAQPAAEPASQPLAAEALSAEAAAALDEPGQPLSLEQAFRLALRQNPGAQNLDERVRQADALILRVWSILLPSLSAQGAITRNNQEIALDPSLFGAAGGAVPPIVITELWNKSFGFSANLTLFNARALPLIKNAYSNVEAQELSGLHQKNELLFVVAQAFYQVQAARQLVQAAAETHAAAQEFLRESQLRRKLGQATKIDELRARLQLLSAQKELDNGKDAVALAKAALAALLGSKTSYRPLPPPEVQPISAPLPELLAEALQQRLDVRALQLAAGIALRSRQESWLKWVPELDATYAWNWNSAGGFAGQNDSWQLIFGAKWSILEGGARISELAERTSQIREARNNLEQKRLEIREALERHALELDKARRNLALAAEQVQLAEENYRLVLRQYKVGLASSLDLVNASTELKERRIGRVLEQLSFELAAMALNKAAGRYQPLLAVKGR